MTDETLTNEASPQSIVRPVVLCGGSGKRLWPLSRKTMPKQFLKLMSNHTLFQETLKAVANADLFYAPTIVSNKDFQHTVCRQAEGIEMSLGSVILEPESRNTAAAITAAALQEYSFGCEEALLLVVPSDHHLEDVSLFHKTIEAAIPFAENGSIVTFGIKPDRPDTGFGYIQRGDELNADGRSGFCVRKFTEKPELEVAQQYLDQGDFFWNSGMFLFRADALLHEVKKYHPQIVVQTGLAMAQSRTEFNLIFPDKKSYEEIMDISIDYVVMENTESGVVVPAAFSWSDIGSWSSIAALETSDNQGNIIPENTLLRDCENTFIQSNGKLVVGIGLKDHIIIDTDDVVLVADREKAQEVKEVVKTLQKMEHPAADEHHKVNRPWGTYESLDIGESHQVKHIMVHPGEKLSLQYHHHRSEHWVIVAGQAEVTVDDKVEILKANQSVYIPVTGVHRLYNPGEAPLHLIEVQCGDYFGEDDIVRLEDVYGRLPENEEKEYKYNKTGS